MIMTWVWADVLCEMSFFTGLGTTRDSLCHVLLMTDEQMTLDFHSLSFSCNHFNWWILRNEWDKMYGDFFLMHSTLSVLTPCWCGVWTMDHEPWSWTWSLKTWVSRIKVHLRAEPGLGWSPLCTALRFVRPGKTEVRGKHTTCTERNMYM